MVITKQRFTCAKCSKVSDIEMVRSAPIAVALASMKAARCPHCGAGQKHLLFGGAFQDAPRLGTVKDRAAWWRKRGEVGLSSETIWAVLTGHSVEPNIPHDPDDLSRCIALLDLIPEWRARLPEVAERYPSWKPIVDNWDHWVSMFRAAKLQKSIRKSRRADIWEPLYKEMQTAVAESERLGK